MTNLVPAGKQEGSLGVRQEPDQPDTSTPQPMSRLRRAGDSIPADMTREEALLRLEAFYRLTRLAGESHYDIGEMARMVARMMADMIGDLCVIMLLNMQRDHYHVAAYHDPDPGVLSLYE